MRVYGVDVDDLGFCLILDMILHVLEILEESVGRHLPGVKPVWCSSTYSEKFHNAVLPRHWYIFSTAPD